VISTIWVHSPETTKAPAWGDNHWRHEMKKFAMRASALAVLTLCHPVFASEVDDLKAEIAAQKAAEAAQQARLDALEQRLNAITSQPAAAPAKAPVAVNKALLTDQNVNKVTETPAGVSLYDNG